jgi:TonB family protein
MKRYLAAGFLLISGFPVDARAQTPALVGVDATPVYTICTLMVGTPVPAQTAPTSFSLSTSNLSALEAAQYAENIVQLQEKLKATFRLERVDAVASVGDWMAPGSEMALDGPAGDLTLVVKAEGVTAQVSGALTGPGGNTVSITYPARKSAHYQVRLTAGPTVVLEKPWPTTVGERSILARQMEANGLIYYIVIAVPTPGEPMPTTLGYQFQDKTKTSRELTMRTAPGIGAGAGTGAGVGFQARTAGSGFVRAPRLTSATQPTLPPEARAAGLKGPVIVSGTIAPDGTVQNITVLKSVKGLDEIAIAAFQQWRYEPAVDENGKSLEVRVTVAFPFKDEPEGNW